MNLLQRLQCLQIDFSPRGFMMDFFVTTILLLALVAPGVPNETPPANRTGTLKRRIIGGANATLSSNKYMVALIREGKFDCGGSVISANYILTAAHCIEPADKYLARVGSLYWFKGGVLYGIRWMLAHPEYNVGENKNKDIGLMQPHPPFDFNDFVGPIILADKSWFLPVGQTAKVSGWGVIYLDPVAFPTQLQTVNITIISNEECAKYYPGEIQTEMFCAGSTAGKDACFGDSGGPLIFDDIQYGVVSWGPDGICASDTQPYGVYASVPKMRDWIDSNME